MPELVETELREGIALIRLARKPANVLTLALRRALLAEFEKAQNNPDVKAIVLYGAGQGFCPGIDLSEYDKELAEPWVDTLCNKIEMSPKPVVAALHGAVIGAGFELALAANARVAQERTRLAMPDIKLSMIPGGGATQRLPRTLGAQTALELLLSGQTLYASDSRLARLMSQLTQDAPLDAACHLARRLSEIGSWRRARDDDRGFRDPEGYQTALLSLRRQITSETGAAADILRCVEAAQLLPFEQGLQFEQSLFRDRLHAPDARAARHILMAERYATLPPGSPKSVTAIRNVALYGSRDRLGELALELLAHGYRVAIVTAGPSEAAAFDAWVARVLQNLVRQGQLSEEDRARRMALLDTSAGPKALTQADLVFDDGTLPARPMPDLQPHLIWALLGRDHRPEARATQLALAKPLLPLHIWSPHSNRALSEASFRDGRGLSDIAGLMGLMERIGKPVLLTKARAGEIEHRLVTAFCRAGLGLLALGARPGAVDAAAERIGFTTAPCRLMDRMGLAKVQAMLGTPMEDSNEAQVLKAYLAAGRIGKSGGQGFFTYDGDQPMADQADDGLLLRARALPLSEAQLGNAILGAIANAAAQIMAADLLRRASEIDFAMVRGLGFDRARGGPLLQVDLSGLFALYKEMRELGRHAALWVPHDRIEKMVKNGEGFFGRSAGQGIS